MPQMAPISWLSLFIIFSITLIIFNTLNYFSFMPLIQSPSSQNKMSLSPLTWKW